MDVAIGNNYYENVTVLAGNQVFYFYSELTNLTIVNETLIGNTLDDLYTIGATNNLVIENFTV
jgi:hypothetical protein